VLLGYGLFRSLQFMAYNTIGYADVTGEDMSAATSFYTTFQIMAPVSAASLFVAAISFLAPLLATRLDRRAGAELSGHRG
jgi:hypothetical protein